MARNVLDLGMTAIQVEGVKDHLSQKRPDRGNLRSLTCGGSTVWQYEKAFDDFMDVFYIRFATLGYINDVRHLKHEIGAFVFSTSPSDGNGQALLILGSLFAQSARDKLCSAQTSRDILYEVLENVYSATMGRWKELQAHIDDGHDIKANEEAFKLQQTVSEKFRSLSATVHSPLGAYVCRLISGNTLRPVYKPDVIAMQNVDNKSPVDSVNALSSHAYPQEETGKEPQRVHDGTLQKHTEMLKHIDAKIKEHEKMLYEHKIDLLGVSNSQLRQVATTGSDKTRFDRLEKRLAVLEQYTDQSPWSNQGSEKKRKLDNMPSRPPTRYFDQTSGSNDQEESDFLPFSDDGNPDFTLELRGIQEGIAESRNTLQASHKKLQALQTRFDRLSSRTQSPKPTPNSSAKRKISEVEDTE